jgi:hypothetical protein
MITLKEFMETFNHRITEGSAYCWNCYGPNAYQLSSWNGLHDDGGWSGNVVFDTVNQTVYEVDVCDYENQRAYRYINPDFKDKHSAEADNLDVSVNQAWDDVDYTDLEEESDWLTKATAIVAGVDYDTRISVPLDIDDDLFMELAVMAHKNDITINKMVERLLVEHMDRH